MWTKLKKLKIQRVYEKKKNPHGRIMQDTKNKQPQKTVKDIEFIQLV